MSSVTHRVQQYTVQSLQPGHKQWFDMYLGSSVPFVSTSVKLGKLWVLWKLNEIWTVWHQPRHKGLCIHFYCCITSYCTLKGFTEHTLIIPKFCQEIEPQCLSGYNPSRQPGLWDQRQMEKMQPQVEARVHLGVPMVRSHSVAGCGPRGHPVPRHGSVLLVSGTASLKSGRTVLRDKL